MKARLAIVALVLAASSSSAGCTSLDGLSGGASGGASDATPDAPSLSVDGGDAEGSVAVPPHPVKVTVKVTALGGATGIVKSSVGDLACPSACVTTLQSGTLLTLTATAPGASVTWQNGCTASGPTCALSLDADVTIEVTLAKANYAFVTSTTFVPGSFKGLAGADAACQKLADAVQLRGTYKAWMSTAAVNAPSRFTGARGWIRTDGLPFADTVSGLTSDTFYYPLRLDENGVDLIGGRGRSRRPREPTGPSAVSTPMGGPRRSTSSTPVTSRAASSAGPMITPAPPVTRRHGSTASASTWRPRSRRLRAPEHGARS